MTIDKSALKALAEARDRAGWLSMDSVSVKGILSLIDEVHSLECRLEVSEDTLGVIRGCLKSAEGDIDKLKRERTDWQAECLKKGFEYVREPDAHYVLADVPEMAALLGQVLGVEVRSKDNDDYGETVSSLSEQLEACNSVYGRAYDLEKEVESLREANDKLSRRNGMLEENVIAMTETHVLYTWLRKKADQPGHGEIAVTINTGPEWVVSHDLDKDLRALIDAEEP
jgi:hypothetical protein